MNIEKTISEQAVSDILTPMLESQDRIVTEDVAPLFEQATGLDTPPASGTVTTTIEESRSVISAIIRKAWTAPLTMLFGASVIGYITAAYTYLRNRLQGSETYGIPDRRSEISASSPLAANLALLNDRKIGGVPEAVDGISLVRFLMDKNLGITELQDDNSEWLPKSINLTSLFPNLTKVTLGFKELVFADNVYPGVLFTYPLKSINMPGVKHIRMVYGGGGGSGVFYNLPEGSEIIAPNCEKIESYGGGYPVLMHSMQGVVKIVLGKLTSFSMFANSTNAIRLIHFEIGTDTAINLDFSKWNPSYVLSDNPTGTDLIEEGSTAQNNLQQFLSNFKTYIAERLADNGRGKTLTLSQSVFSEIWDSQGQPQVKGDGLDQLRADIHRIIRTVKQWAVNRA